MNDRLFLELQTVGYTTRLGNVLLENISFQVERGDRLAIIGPSGSGKTTLLRLLNRLINPSFGTIFFDGHPINNILIVELRRQIVLVPQEPRLLGMTVKEALVYPLVLQKLPERKISQTLDFLLDNLQIPEDWLEKKELQLSLGQRQLVCLARALAMEPKLLLLDEPTSALDVGRSDRLLNIFKKLGVNTTIIMVTHQLELAANFANKVLYLEAGKIQKNLTADTINWRELKEILLSKQRETDVEDF